MSRKLVNSEELVRILDQEFDSCPETKGWVTVSPPIDKVEPVEVGCNWDEVVLSSGRPGVRPSAKTVAAVIGRVRTEFNLR